LCFSNTIHNFCVGNITKSEKKIAQDGDSDTSLCLKPLSMADVKEVIYDIVGRTPLILNEK
jgi:hypothetical protein